MRITLHTKVNEIALRGFMDDFYAQTAPHPFGACERIWDSRTRIELDIWNGTIYLHSIETIERGRGDGTRGLKFVLDLARYHRVNITGCVQGFGRTLPHATLVEWYKRHGCRVEYNSGKANLFFDGENA
jgi:hypothetical protein